MMESQPRSILRKNPKKVSFEEPPYEDHYGFGPNATEENPWETTWPSDPAITWDRPWDEDIPEEPAKPVSRWEEVNFCYRGESYDPPCQWKSENGKYYQQSGLCRQYDHHTHYYCRKCKFNFNPSGFWKKPTEESKCDCPEHLPQPQSVTPPTSPRPPTPPREPQSQRVPELPRNEGTKKKKSRPNRPPRCYICKKRGHLIAECPEKEPEKEPTETMVVIETEEVEIAQHEPIEETPLDMFLEEVTKQSEIIEMMKETSEEIEDETLREIGENIWKKFSAITVDDDFSLGQMKGVQHNIHLKTDRPVRARPRTIPNERAQDLKNEIEEMLRQGIIEESNSEYAANVVMVRKPNGKWRICVDYSLLNAITEIDAYPIPVLHEILAKFHGMKYFSVIDARKGFYQIKMNPDHKQYTSFVVLGVGSFQFLVMPFGLCNAPGTFQRFMDRAFRKQVDAIYLIYMDDIIIFSPDLASHVKHIEAVMTVIRDNNIYANPEKCSLLKKQIKFLGHKVSAEGIEISPDKTKALKELASPKNPKELMSVMGLLSWFRKFIPNFAAKVRGLWDLKKAEKYKWEEHHEKALRDLIEELCSAPILAHPNFEKPFIIYTDASIKGLGAMLTQNQEGVERVIEYASKALNPHEKNYPTTELEFLGIRWAILKLRHYLGIQPFQIHTDHAALVNLQAHTNATPKRQRWLGELQSYQFKVKHVKGKDNGPADALSRLIPDEVTSEELWVSRRKGEPMKDLLQTPRGKTDPGESSQQAALRETEEETGIVLNPKDLRYVAKDLEYNCDIYVAFEGQIEPQHTEPTKMTQWN